MSDLVERCPKCRGAYNPHAMHVCLARSARRGVRDVPDAHTQDKIARLWDCVLAADRLYSDTMYRGNAEAKDAYRDARDALLPLDELVPE